MNYTYIAFCLYVLVTMIGWVMNIIKIIGLDDVFPLTGMTVIRIIGIFIPPLGGLVGWF